MSNQHVYSKTPNDIEYYLKDSNNKEIYVKNKGVEIYAFNFRDKKEFYAKADNKEYYAKHDHKEIYAIDLQKDFEYFTKPEQTYTKNVYDNEFYPLDIVGRHKVLQVKHPIYAKREEKPFYPTDEYGNEFALPYNKSRANLILSETGQPIAPKKRDGSVNYIKNNNIEIPYIYNNEAFVGKNSAGIGQYPRNAFGDEYYPNNNINPKYATDNNGNYKYALSSTKKIMYPYISGEPSYLISDNQDSYTILKNYLSYFLHYVRKNGKEIYPIKIFRNNQFTEMIISNLYAEDEHNERYYPKDSLNNEYINSSGDLLKSYPITNDNQTIIPNYDNEPKLKSTDLELSKQIKCLLYRPEFKRYDFLLNCSSKNNPILHSESFSNNSHLMYIIVALCTVVFVLFFVLLI